MGTRKQPAEAGTGEKRSDPADVKKKRAREIYANRQADRLERIIAERARLREAAESAAAAPVAEAERTIRLTIGDTSFDVRIQATATPAEPAKPKRGNVIALPRRDSH